MRHVSPRGPRFAPAPIALSIILAVVLALSNLGHANAGLPDGVPDLRDARIRAGWQPYVLGNVEGDPDFPLVVYLNKSSGSPTAVMMVIDARNGTNSWSLASDPVIVFAVFADLQQLSRLYYDQGFAAGGRPSGQYAGLPHPDPAALSALLKRVREQHRTYM